MAGPTVHRELRVPLIAQVPDEHDRRGDQVEAVQQPDRTRWQAVDIDRVHDVAGIGHEDVAAAVGAEIFRAVRLDQYRQRTSREEDGRYGSGDDMNADIHR